VDDRLTDWWRLAFTSTPRELFIPCCRPATRGAVSAYRWWTELGCADRQQFHLTVTRERQWIWLNDPANTIATLA
jgi:hypothetical protein